MVIAVNKDVSDDDVDYSIGFDAVESFGGAFFARCFLSGVVGARRGSEVLH